MDTLEWIGAVIGLAYIWLEYRASIWLWLAGIVMPAIYIFVYYDTGFYADMGINIYYLVAAVYGWVVWMGRKQKDGERRELPITRMKAGLWLPIVGVSAVFFALIAWWLVDFTDSTVPYGDALTTALSITGLWMLARKYAEQWLVWLVVDVVCCGLYLYKGLYPTGVLYGLYAVIAVFGYFKWLRIMKRQEAVGMAE